MPAPLPLTDRAVACADGRPDAEALFAHLFGDAREAFWLDAGVDPRSGWSLIGTGVVETDPVAVRSIDLSAPAEASRIPFLGGWVGWLPYEHGAAASGAPVAESEAAPTWIAVTRAVAVDHATGDLHALAAAADIDSWVAAVREAVAAPHPAPAPPATGARTAAARHGVVEYTALVEECRSAIQRGDAYQLCLTTRFTAARPDDPFTVYRRLRAATPAHHGGYLRTGDQHVLSASPEQFLATGGGRASTSPIKGTRPRGVTPELDARLAEELRTDVKERAENVMIVDLMRNDLSHIGVPGTVEVERLWDVETYPAVHQLVSTVSVRLRDGVTFGDLCDAAFPAGSMTGAPKLSAMTILHRLERAPRGIYSGCFGHVGLDGRVDLAMVIRTIVVDAHGAYVGAGGGITWLSRPDAEAAEVATKARAPLAALGATLPQPWRELLPVS
ncbi:anthranilate synthase component I family protein [Microbacterium esteraromaticum]|uniref:anthranilate synthase component I family protein n=1 Tax=Microbacterium esteraromaticum TaxID=57043 RepID=UPI002174F632|nr:anthranilate synthase component I family protein [Microbacterium esteraromaticum]